MMVYLANELSRKGAAVTIYLVNKKGPYLNEISDHIQLTDLKASHGVKSVFFKLRRILKASDLDVIVATHPHVNSVLGIAGVGLSAKPILIFREANTPSARYSDNNLFATYAFKIGNSFADHYIAVSDGVKDDMVDYYNIDGSKITRIYNPLYDDSILEKANESVTHPWLNQEEPVIVTMGRIVPQKDHITLLRAFSGLAQTMGAKLLVLGEKDQDPEYTARVRKEVEELGLKGSVELSGFKKNPFKYLSKASLFVLSSRFEGLPGALVQALACGCPVVSTDCPSGPAEILDNGRFGTLVPVGDVEELAKAMAYNLKVKTHEPDELRKRAEDFSVEKSSDQYYSVIQALISKK